jgi:uncharacterized protein with PQ loop repeat
VIATILGLIGTTLGVLRSWPQVRDIVCRGQADGVSVHTWALTLLNNATWLTLGLIIAAPPVVISNALSATGCIAVLAAMARRRPDRGLPRAVAVALAGAALVALVSRGGPTGLTVLGTALAVSMFIPQLVRVLRSSAAGVSAWTWLVTAFSSGVWVLYAFALGRPPLAACHAVILPASLVIADRARREPACREAGTWTTAA